MSKKCFATITLYVFFLVFMIGTAYIFSYLNFSNVLAKVLTIIGLMIISTALALTVEKGSIVTIAFNAVLWGTALSFLFDHLGNPDLLQLFYVVLVMVAWFALFCFLTGFSFTKENHAFSLVFWGIALAAADVVFAIHFKNVLGWTSLILLAPFITFFAALPGEAENFTDHMHHVAIYLTLPALSFVLLLLFFRVPVGSFEINDFLPEVDDDYIFTYCPKSEDDKPPTAKDLSDFM